MDDQRIDKWLWCARLFKTRGQASDAVRSGRVLVNGARAKPARIIRAGDAVAVRKPPYDFELLVTGLSRQRVAAARIAELYVEDEASVRKRAALARSISSASAQGAAPSRKPTRREREERDRFKRSL